MKDTTHTWLNSTSFEQAVLRSDQLRIIATAATFVLLAAFAIGRDAFFHDGVQSTAFGYTVAIIGAVLMYEGWMFRRVARARRTSASISRSVRFGNVIVEALLPTIFIMLRVLAGGTSPFDALVSPTLSIYFILLILSTLRLDVNLCLLSGIVSAVGYAGVVTWTMSTVETSTSSALHPSFYMTTVFMLFVASAIAAGVASQLRTHLGAAIQEAQARHQAVMASRNGLIFGLAKLAEYRDTDTGTHLERIALYAEILAKALQPEHDVIDEAWIETIRIASSMHDIGKVGIPDAVLQKPGRLDADERSVIERHPGLGADVLRSIEERLESDPLLVMSERIAAAHHERWDGRGYPNGLAGESIDLAARIIAVADVYDALTSKRVYKPAMTHANAVRIIDEGRGTQFDPSIVDAFHRVEASFDAVRARYHALAD